MIADGEFAHGKESLLNLGANGRSGGSRRREEVENWAGGAFVTFTIDFPQRFDHWALIVTDGDRLQYQAATAEPGALIHHIIDGDRSVIVLGSAGGPIAHAGYQSDGLLAVLSEERGQVLSVEQAGGTFIERIARTAS